MTNRITANASNTGIIYKTQDGRNIEILINNFDPSYVDSTHSDYHNYDETSTIFQSEYVSDTSIIVENFFEEPAPSFGIENKSIPVTTGSQSTVPLIGTVTHYVVPGENIIVNVTNPGHLLHPGIVVRELYSESSGVYYTNDVGVGTGSFSTLNTLLADDTWQKNADRIGRESIFEDNQLPPTPPTPKPKPQGPSTGVGDTSDGFGDAQNAWDPLTLDLNGDGSVTLNTENMYFDIDGDGFGEAIQLINPNDGFLVHDLNNDGVINSSLEMFGDATTDGFTALTLHDDNRVIARIN